MPLPSPPGRTWFAHSSWFCKQLDRLQRRVTTMADEVEEARGVCGVERIEFVERRGDALAPGTSRESDRARRLPAANGGLYVGREDQAVLQRNSAARGRRSRRRATGRSHTVTPSGPKLLILAVCRATARNHQLPRHGTLLGDQEHRLRRSALRRSTARTVPGIFSASCLKNSMPAPSSASRRAQ